MYKLNGTILCNEWKHIGLERPRQVSRGRNVSWLQLGAWSQNISNCQGLSLHLYCAEICWHAGILLLTQGHLLLLAILACTVQSVLYLPR